MLIYGTWFWLRLSSVTDREEGSAGSALILLWARMRDSSFLSSRRQEGNESRWLLLASSSLRFFNADRLAGRLLRRLP